MTGAFTRVVSRAASDDVSRRQFADDVHYYLSQDPRQLPSRYLYDALGSALFDAICQLPWYRITRAERRLVAIHSAEIFAHLPELESIVELGGGNGEKLATLLGSRPAPSVGLTVHLVDVSSSALALSGRVLSALDGLRIVTHQASYENGLAEAARHRLPGQRLTLFLGSNIGNFDPPAADAFVLAVRRSQRAGDALLLGADLVKPEAELIAAYDDPLGVTAAFNRNLLVRINHELDGDFRVERFSHRAVWNRRASRVEMHLVSAVQQRVCVRAAALDVEFASGETIWTESSYKYTPGGIVDLLDRAGFSCVRQWVEPRAGFALTLAEAI